MILVCCGLASCTNAGGSSSPVSSIVDAVKNILQPDASLNAVEKQVLEIQSRLNQDQSYALTQDDVSFLKTEGVLNDENEIKAWVK